LKLRRLLTRAVSPTAASSVVALVAVCAPVASAMAQSAAQTPSQTVTVTGRQDRVSVSGFGEAPLSRSPVQAQVVNAESLADAGVSTLMGLTRFDASLGDAYNAEGYWSNFTARGFVLDNRSNYRRDGLPINAETALPLDNKERIEVLKGVSGIQAGQSAPGGLVNLVVKRPVDHLRRATVEWQQNGTVAASMDWSERFGPERQAGLRVNAAATHLDPVYRDAKGQRRAVALAADTRLGRGVIEVEMESSHQSQPSVPGFSLLGDKVPDARRVDPRVNLNNQRWTQPVVLDGQTASVRWQQPLNAQWRFMAHALQQRLTSDDRTAFPFGVFEPDYSCPQWCDRFASDGTFSYWEFISNRERRNTRALDVSLQGRLAIAGWDHQVQLGALRSRFEARFQDQVFDLAGKGRIDGALQAAPSAGYTSANTNRDERSTELYLRDKVRPNPWAELWFGLRHTRLQRNTVLTSAGDEGLQPTHGTASATIPWLAFSHDLGRNTLGYLSWGEGLETEVVPNQLRYTNRGQPLPALKSRQAEVGLKHSGDTWSGSVAFFSIRRPQSADQGACDSLSSCTRVLDGSAVHKGVEAQAQGLIGVGGPWAWNAGVMLLNAQRAGSSDAAMNGLRPVNVPAQSLRLGGSYRVATMHGLELGAQMVAEGNRTVLPGDNVTVIPGWSRVDLSARWRQRSGDSTFTWRAGLDNATDRRAWKESPYSFGHAYLFPLAPRTARLSVQVDL
jgi:iron complex outermembrane recepter protein